MTAGRQALLRLLVVGLFLVGCTPTNPPNTASAKAVDFSRPGAAQAVLTELLATSGSKRALQVTVTTSTAQVSVLDEKDTPITLAYRDNRISEVHSDLAYVDQATFDPTDFNLSDVGALFRAAAGVSGSRQNQSLNIVDYSGGQVMMSVSTVPESRTVFFNPDGSLLPPLDFNTPGGIAAGIADAAGRRTWVQSVAVQSEQGAWVDYPGDPGTTVRRSRTSLVPATSVVRAEELRIPEFMTSQIDPAAVWKVLDSVRGRTADPGAPWSVVIDDRDEIGLPRMHFTIGGELVVTDLAGRRVN